MAAAFDRCWLFSAIDVHMSAISSFAGGGRVSFRTSSKRKRLWCFSYSAVLGAGEGWAKSILFNANAREQISNFIARQDSAALACV